MQLDDVLAATLTIGGQLVEPARATEFDGFAFDSRRLQAGEMFVAIRTAKADGHDYVADALEHGATGLLVERPVEAGMLERYGATCVRVSDTRNALEAWARYILAKHHPSVIAITGGVGKTSTQHGVRAILTQGYDGDPSVFANDNYNDLLGLPIALGRLLPTHEQAILELGTDSRGEVAKLAAMIGPRIGIVTNVAEVHARYLGTPDQIAREYAALVEALPRDGYAILNFDDERVRAMKGRAVARVLFFSVADGRADVCAEQVRAHTAGVDFVLRSPQGRHEIHLPLLGRHQVHNALAAAAAGLASNFALEEIARALANLRPLPGRLNPLAGKGGVRILDDSFSASPASTRAALSALSLADAGRRFVVLGDMVGLGSYEETAHRDAGRQAAQVGDYLITKGDRAAVAAQAARAAGMSAEKVFATFADDDVATIVSRLAQPDDVVLVKGSEDLRMERVVERLIDGAADSVVELVRQDAGWKQLVVLHRERPTWLEIDLGAIAGNVRRAKQVVGDAVEIMAVLKADAYGHGATRVAQTALLHGASMLGTACLSEAVTLRERGIASPILVLGYSPPWQARDLVRYDLSTAVYSVEVARHLSRAARLQGDRAAKVHLKLDTGMGRLGLAPDELLPVCEQIRDLPGVEIEGIFTHFATADHADQSYALGQLTLFQAALAQLERAGIRPRYVHAANSAALLTLPESRFNMVRLGIALYGLDPSPSCRCPAGFRSALAFKTQVAQLKRLPAGSSVSYGASFKTQRPSTIAVIPVGYGDGFRRGPQNAGEVLVRGRRAPIIGVVCMDMCMIDVTDIPGVRQGDEVVIVGQQGDERITVEELAQRFGTISYEVVAQILPRVPREVF